MTGAIESEKIVINEKNISVGRKKNRSNILAINIKAADDTNDPETSLPNSGEIVIRFIMKIREIKTNVFLSSLPPFHHAKDLR